MPASVARSLTFAPLSPERPASPGAGRLRFQAYIGPKSLPEIRERWSTVVGALRRRCFQDLIEWHEAYAQELAEHPDELRYFVAERGGVPAAIFPLASRRRRLAGVPLRTLEFPQHDHLALRDLIFERDADNEHLVQDFVEYLRHDAAERWDALILEDLVETSAAAFSLESATPSRLLFEEGRPCQYLDATLPVEDRLNGLSSRFRRALRHSSKHQGDGLRLERVRNPGKVDAALQEFMDMEASGWKGAAGTAIKCDPRLVAFYRSVARSFAARGCLEINLLRLGGESIAAQFCLKVDRCLYGLKTTYDERHAKLQPGHLILEHMLRLSATERDIDILNCTSSSAWMDAWKPLRYRGISAFIFNDTAAGLAGYVGLRAKQYVRPATDLAAHLGTRAKQYWRPMYRKLKAKREPSLTVTSPMPLAPVQ